MKQQLFYAVMYTVNAEFLGSGALYVDGKVMLKGLTNPEIDAFVEKYGVSSVNRIDALGFNPTDDPDLTGLSTTKFSSIMTQLAEQEPNEKLGVMTLQMGQWLYDNHPAFMPVATNE